MKKMRIMLLAVISLFAVANVSGQCKSFQLTDRGDTINCVDHKGRKQGPWLVKVAPLRGNPGHEEEGEFIDDKKEGIWRIFSEVGDVVAVQTYKWGLLNGKSQFYSVLGMEREESWWAIDPLKLYDTIDVPDLFEDAKYRTVVIKNEGRSMKHGKWTYFDPQTGFIQKSEEYIRDSSVNPLEAFGVKSRKPAELDSTGKPKKNDKPAVVLDYEKKNAGKKKIKVRDGSTGY